jgi:lysophospholipase L1-like esterase
LDPIEREALFDDDIHLKAAGHRRVAHLVAEELTAAGVLREEPPAPRQDSAPP